MKSGIFKWSVALTSMLSTSIPLSVNAQVVYGLDNARHFSTHQSGPYFVQVGSFRSVGLAQQFKNKLASRVHYAVQIGKSGSNHTVIIGPLSSIAEVRSVETGMSTTKIAQSMPKPIHTPIARKVYSSHLAGPAQAPSLATDRNQHWYVGMNAGLMQSRMSKNNMTVYNGSDYPPPLNVDQYSLKSHQPVMVDIQAGHRWQRNQQWLPAYSLALRYQHVFTKNVQGTVTEYSLPEFANYNYRWGVGADALSLYSKINLVEYSQFMPYIDLGLGFSSTQSKNYSETALSNVTPRYSPDYAAKRNSQVTYNLGAGLDFILTQNLLVSAGYEYQTFGNLSSGIGQGPNWQSEKLNLGKLNTNMGLVGFTYLFDGSMRTHNQAYK